MGMRFTCEHCGKRYVTSDVLQAGRVYRTKCKACGGVITVRGGAETSAPTGEVPVPGGPGRPSAPSLASLTAVSPTPPSTPAARPTPPPAAARPSSSVPLPPPTAPSLTPIPDTEPRYIDLFEGEGPDA